MEVARTYVQDLGGGLIMLGGDQSFGLGGYYKTTIEEILPVRSDFEKEKEKPSLAMMLVIDKSGSMGGEKIEMAKEAARAAVELLGPSDKVGVLAFEGENFWVSEMHPCSDKGFVLDQIAGLEAGGGTVMAPAMEEAHETLRSTVAKLKHVIILTDGMSSPGDFEGIAQAMAADRITVSTVAMGATPTRRCSRTSPGSATAGSTRPTTPPRCRRSSPRRRSRRASRRSTSNRSLPRSFVRPRCSPTSGSTRHRSFWVT